MSFSDDPKIGTSWGGTRINGVRCPNKPMPDCSHANLPEDAPMPRKVNATAPVSSEKLAEYETYIRKQLNGGKELETHGLP